jgi:hypothetical protein
MDYNPWFLAFLALFAVVSVFLLRACVLAMNILRYVKEHDPEKCEWLMSSDWPILDGFINESFIWANSRRFGQFVRDEANSVDPDLRALIRSHRKARTAMVISLVIGLLVLLMAGLAAAP